MAFIHPNQKSNRQKMAQINKLCIIIQNQMKRILIIVIITLVSCSDKVNEEKLMSLNIDKLYLSDQEDRKNNEINNWSIVSKRDEFRRKRVGQLIDSNKIISAKDYAKAAMIFQHGVDSSDYLKAVEFMKTAMKIDSTVNKSLFAAATDRYLLSIGKPQVYGTQYIQEGNGTWELKNYDTTAISDEEKKRFGVGSLNEQMEKLKELNKGN